jgi:TPR repeat protein
MERLHAAKNGDREAQFAFGCRCASQDDHDQAAVWWRRSAEQGWTEAQRNLTVCYLEGNGVAEDLVQAATWCQKISTHQDAKKLISAIVLRAAVTGNLACLQQIQKDGTFLARVADGGVMHAAAANGHLTIVKWLHEQGLDAAAETNDGLTPAIFASNRGHIKLLQLLHVMGVDISARNSVGRTALDHAKHPAIAAFLEGVAAEKDNESAGGSAPDATSQLADERLRKQAEDGDPQAQFHLGNLYEAAQEGDVQAAVWWQKSAEQGFPPSLFNLAMCTCSGENGLIVDLMQAATWCQKLHSTPYDGEIAKGINKQQGVPHVAHLIVHKAVAAGNLVCLQQMHDCGLLHFMRDTDGETAMHVAANNGQMETVKWLHTRGLDAAASMENGFTPAIIASNRGDIDLLEFLHEIGVDLLATNSTGRTALNYAKNPATNKYLSAVSEKKDSVGAVEIRKLAQSGQAAAQYNLGCLFESGTGVEKNMADAVLWFHKSALQGHQRAQIHLAFCNLDGTGVIKDPEEGVRWYHKGVAPGAGRRPVEEGVVKQIVHRAVQSGNLECLKQLKSSITPSTTDFGDGRTAMHVAAQAGQLGPMKWLHQHLQLDATALEKSEDSDGWTPAIIASREGNVTMLKWLHEIGVDLWAKNAFGKAACDFAKKVVAQAKKSSRESVTAVYLHSLAAAVVASVTTAGADDAMNALLQDEDIATVPKPASAGSSKRNKKKNKSAAKKAAVKTAASATPELQHVLKPAAADSATPEQQRAASAAAAKKDKKKQNKAERAAKATADRAEADGLAAAKDAEDYEAMVVAQRQVQQREEEEEAAAAAEAEEKVVALSLAQEQERLVAEAQADTEAAMPAVAPSPLPPTPPMPARMPAPMPAPTQLTPPPEEYSVRGAAATEHVVVPPDYTIPGLTGLVNPRGSNNCFLNAVVQVNCACTRATHPVVQIHASRVQLLTPLPWLAL